ncbi:MAG: DUF885 domain-containing protein [Methanobacteriota archaeon]
MPDADVDAFAKDLLDWYVEWNPLFATSVGIHDRDHLLPKGTYDAQLEERRRLRSFLRRLEGIERRPLSPGKKIDHGVLRNSLRLFLFQDEGLGIWRSFPDGAGTAADALFSLFLRDFAPLPRRLESITGRLEATPRFLAETKTRVREPVKLWCEIGLESAEHVPEFYAIIVAAGQGVLPGSDAARLEEAAAKSTEAARAYVRWIRDDLLPRATVRVGVGAARFRRLVRLRELGLTVEEIYAVGKRYLRESKRELARIATEIRPGATVEEAKEIVKSDHPEDFAGALAYTARTMDDSKRFIRERGLASIPPNEELRVLETPSYLRHVIPFAAYNQPARFETRQQGIYIVTAHPDKPEMLRELGYAHIRNTAVHEGYPGHHLQLTCANLNPSLARVFGYAIESVEGWAHYCEDMMKQSGFSADPATKFVQVTDQIWRACRILIDVDLHCGRMTFDEAVDFLVRESGMERPAALAEVKRYTYNPAYQLSYLIGKHLIVRLKKDVKRGFGKDYSDRLFHDTFLYAGSLPMKHMRLVFEHKIQELKRLRRRGR